MKKKYSLIKKLTAELSKNLIHHNNVHLKCNGDKLDMLMGEQNYIINIKYNIYLKLLYEYM